MIVSPEHSVPLVITDKATPQPVPWFLPYKRDGDLCLKIISGGNWTVESIGEELDHPSAVLSLINFKYIA